MFEQGHMLDIDVAARVPSSCIGRMLERREAIELLAQIERRSRSESRYLGR